MKYVVILGDGMADYPSKVLENHTPLEVAKKPNIDNLCKRGQLGLVKTVPDGMKPGSDVANLSMMGYAPDKYYTGRSPLEALSIGIDLKDDDVAVRCNLVTLSNEDNFADKTMLDYSAGEISTEEARELIEYLQKQFNDENFSFYAGVSYRHCLVMHGAKLGTDFTPPHDISDKKITNYLPKGEFGDIYLDIMLEAYELLKNHPVNQKRIAEGKNPANSIWLWGEGSRPNLTPFEEKYGMKGAVISAVDLIKGIGIGAKMQVIEVEGATGTYTTNFKGKAEAAIKALKNGCDYVYIHMEAPDECGHQGDAANKVKSIELIDSIVVKYVKEQLDAMNEDYKILIAPDHPTPLKLKTHTSDPVPFIIYSHRAGEEDRPADGVDYNEDNGEKSNLKFQSGEELVKEFLYGAIPTANEDKPSSDKPVADTNNVVATPIDDNSEDKKEEVKEDKEDKKAKKEKKQKGEKKKLGKVGKIAIIASVLVVAILVSVIVPVVIFHAPRIFVKSDSDFVASKTGSFNKYFYVLDKNISCENLTLSDSNIYSVDLNKHTLNVRDTFKIESSKEGTLYIGTRKGKDFVTNKKSNLKARTIIVDAPNMDVKLLANVSCETLRVKSAKSLTLYKYGDKNVSTESSIITADKVVFAGDVTEIPTSKEITIVGYNDGEKRTEVVVENNVKIGNKLKLIDSDLTIKANASVSTLLLEESSTAQIEGKIVSEINGGKQVIMMKGHSCPTYKNVENLIIFRDNTNHTMLNCKNVVYVEELAQPIDILIEEREHRIYCKAAKVKHASKYEFVISNGNAAEDVHLTWEKNLSADPEFDITQYVNTPGNSYTITVTPKGNYEDVIGNSEKLNSFGSGTLYTDGKCVSVQYNYIIVLPMATGLEISPKYENGVLKSATLKFNVVPNASDYQIYIDGKKMIETKETSVEIGQFINKVGDHSIRVIAIETTNDNIKNSPDAMIAFSTTEKLSAVDETSIKATLNESTNANDVVNASITIDWKGVQNGFEYLVQLQVNGSAIYDIGRTSMIKNGNVGYNINFNDIEVVYDKELARTQGYKIIITAIGHDYYETSDSASQIVPPPQVKVEDDTTSSGNVPSGELGSGELGSGELGSGETGSGELGSGNEPGSGETGSGEGETGSGNSETGSGNGELGSGDGELGSGEGEAAA